MPPHTCLSLSLAVSITQGVDEATVPDTGSTNVNVFVVALSTT